MQPDELRKREALNARIGAYSRLFDPKNADARLVLEDLAAFCRAAESTFHPDARVAAQLDGRREVWNRVQQHVQLSHETLWRLAEPRLAINALRKGTD